ATKPPSARVPLHSAADVGSEERLGLVDAKGFAAEQAESANAAGDIGHDRRAVWHRHDDVTVVVEDVGRPLGAWIPEAETLRDADRAGDLAFDAQVPVEVVSKGTAELVVPEARRRGIAVLGEHENASRDDGDLGPARPRRTFLRMNRRGGNK